MRWAISSHEATDRAEHERLDDAIWSTPGVHFQQCGKPKGELLQGKKTDLNARKGWSKLPDQVECPAGEMPIGDFVGHGHDYNFSCCSAGEQCGGCRKIEKSRCVECAAGYVRQRIPILNVSMCFQCDDIPWHDAKGLTCQDYEDQGACTGFIKEGFDQPFQGLSPSEACCACGGGSLRPTPSYMPFAEEALYIGQSINSFPQPQAYTTTVEPKCNLADWDLRLAGSGGISGRVASKGSKGQSQEISCSIGLTQDPMRGLVSTVNLEVPVSKFSYGKQILLFKYWGLDVQPAVDKISVQHAPLKLNEVWENFSMECTPACPWLELTGNGALRAGPLAKQLDVHAPTLSNFGGLPSCDCEVFADFEHARGSKVTESTNIVAVQARLWRGGSYKPLAGRVGVALLPTDLQEALPGLHYEPEDSSMLPVLENASTGERFVVAPAIPPSILDVQCRDHTDNTDTSTAYYRWSRLTGDVTRKGQAAFNLDPSSGQVTGTPLLDLSAEGRGSLRIDCSIALGGPQYDKVLPVAVLTIKIVDDMCWVPTSVSGQLRWKELPHTSCLAMCRKRADCAGIHENGKKCKAVVSDGKPEAFTGQLLLRLDNCSEEDTQLNLTVKGAKYVEGIFSPSNVFKDKVSFSRAGPTPELQLHLVHRAFAETWLPNICSNASWILLHANASDFQNGSVEAPEFFGAAMACVQEDVVNSTFAKGKDIFDLEFLEAELDDPVIANKPKAKQKAELKPSVPSCPQPSDDQGFIYGTVEDPAHFSLEPCQCFGEAHAEASPVIASSNDAVPRDGRFNNGSMQDQLIFSGPYTCEATALLLTMEDATHASCAAACRARDCKFYQFTATAESCALFVRCDFLQQVGVQLVNELYGIAPKGDYCHIANPEECWREIKRRSYLSLTPSNLPSCLFQPQYEACDALQQISGVQSGHCPRQYISARSEDAAEGMRKVPLPDEFPSASQISVSCNYTSRMFTKLEGGLKWDGPRSSAVFTCVSGRWVGELGEWQHLENLTCQECIQVGTASLVHFTATTMQEVYFLEHRQVQLTNAATTGPKCPRAGKGKREHCLFGLDMVDTSERAWNFYGVDGNEELLLQQLKFAAQTKTPPKLQLVSFSQRNAYIDYCLTNDQGMLVLAESPCKGGFAIADYPEGSTIAYYKDAETQEGEPLFLVPDTTDTGFLSLVPKSGGLPKEAFWSIHSTNDGRKLLRNNYDSDQCIGSFSTTPLTSNADGFQRLYYPDALCPDQFLVGLYTTHAGYCGESNYFKCGSWGNRNMVYSGSCTPGQKDLDGVTGHVIIKCGPGQALQKFTGCPPPHGHEWNGPQSLSWTCCDVQMPNYATFENETFEVRPIEDSFWKYACDNKGATGVFMTGFDWHSETDHSEVYCVGNNMKIPQKGRVSLGACDSPFAPFESELSVPSRAVQGGQTSKGLVELSSCQTSLLIEVNSTDMRTTVDDVSLEIQDATDLSAQQRQAYQYMTQLKVVTGTAEATEVLFVCQAMDNNRSYRICASRAQMSRSDLEAAYAVQANLTVEKVCPMLVNQRLPLDLSVVTPIQPHKGMTMKVFSDIMMDQPYISSRFGNPKDWPFFFAGAGAARADAVGFLSIPRNGDALWGISCPEGAIVVSEAQTLPHCLHIGASPTQENFSSFSGSVTCPPGTAISGWYNLPGIPVKRSEEEDKGGPKDWTGLLVFCRKTNLLASCVQPEKPHCPAGHAVNSVSYSGNQFKLGCCRLQKPLGTTLTPNPRKAKQYQPFEGYYCPTAMGTTGSAVYEKSPIGILGEPGLSASVNVTWSLSWNKFDGTWVLRQGHKDYASVESNALSPVEITANASFSATAIRPLVSESKAVVKKSLFPTKKPTYPKLVQFRPVQPDYAEYCDPWFLESPSSFKGSISETNPCYHTFNTNLVEGLPETRGISEGSFWSCAERSKARSYLRSLSDYSTGKASKDRASEMQKFNQVQTDLELAAAIISAIPWGDYGTSAEKSTQKAGEEAERPAAEAAEENVNRLARYAQKIARSKVVAKLKTAFDDFGKHSAGTLLKGFSTLMKRVNDMGILDVVETARALHQPKGPKADEEQSPLTNLTEIVLKTVPNFDPPQFEFDKELAEAAWTDCLPLQAGLSKVMCDLFCVENSVRSGTAAVLESLEKSQSVLLTNLQALLNYQTDYILYAIGTVVNDKPGRMEPPKASLLLSGLRQIDFEHARATVPSLSRDILDWHQFAGAELYSRLAALTLNASNENWPYRMKAAKGMLHHFQAGFHRRLYGMYTTEAQLKSKMRVLQEDTAAQRQQAVKAQALHVHFGLQAPSSLVGSLLVQSFRHCHEKHSAYSMLQMKALSQMDAALMSAKNFSKCNTDTRGLHEAWQAAMRADQRSQEALLEAWAATVSSAEHLLGALEDESLLLRLVDLNALAEDDIEDSGQDVEKGCNNTTALVQRYYARAVSELDRDAWLLLRQVITFQAMAEYQEKQLKHKRLGYVTLPNAWGTMTSHLAAVANPASGLGQQLAVEVLVALGPHRCPVPEGCRGLLQLDADIPHGPFLHHCGSTRVLRTHHAAGLVQQLRLHPEPLRSLSLLEDLGL